MLTAAGQLGDAALRFLTELFYLVRMFCAVLVAAARPGNWRRTVRLVFANQLLFTGVEATSAVLLVGFFVGISIVLQSQLWFSMAGQSGLLGSFLVVTVIRELAPLLVNLLVISRSGSAMIGQLGLMRIRGEVQVLEVQGVDPFLYLLVPRVVAAVVSVLCLTVVFILSSLVTGYTCGSLVDMVQFAPTDFANIVIRALSMQDVLALLTKGVLPAAMAAIICCTGGLRVESSIAEISVALTQSLSRAVLMTFFLSATITLLIY